MEVRLTAEQQAQIAELASRRGQPAEDVVLDAVEQMLNDERFRLAAEEGFASLDRGEFLTHEEVGARIEKLLDSHG